MNTNDTKEVKELLVNFFDAFEEKLADAWSCGALSGDENPVMVAKVVLYLTAQGVKPLSIDGREILSNLKHFI